MRVLWEKKFCISKHKNKSMYIELTFQVGKISIFRYGFTK